MDREELTEYAILTERWSWSEVGRQVDGSPYNCGNNAAETLINEALLFFGNGDKRTGRLWIRAQLRLRKTNGEVLADEKCGNWQLWEILNQLNVSRVRE